jgi:hypothetical protein
MSITVTQMAKPSEYEIRCAEASLEVNKALLYTPDASYLVQATDRQGVLRGMTLPRSAVEMLEAVLREVASGHGVQLESLSESMSAAQAEKLLNELAPGFRIP